jgi:acetyl esterase/lipase
MKFWRGKHGRAVLVALSVIAFGARTATAADEYPPEADDAANVQVPAFTLPYSIYASPESKNGILENTRAPAPAMTMPNADIGAIRKAMDERFFGPLVAKQNARYAVAVTPQAFDGVMTDVYTPKEGILGKNKKRVLIELHEGGFLMGARTAGAIESIPIAAVGRIKVIAVNFRQGPEYKFPAASEDVATVYRALLKQHYKPKDIGIYGCSAGGYLAGEAVAWFDKAGLPQPAAIGIFCGSVMPYPGLGDSAYVAGRLGGNVPPAPRPPDALPFAGSPYFAGARIDDPLVTPSASPQLLAKFPATLFVTGTRDAAMSSAITSHNLLAKAGVQTELFVWDGVDHGFFANPDFPESRDAYDIIVGFFDRHLGKKH